MPAALTCTLAAAVAILCAALILFVPAVPQDLAYHVFHAQASCCGLPHAELVLTNLPFLWIGLAALVRMRRRACTTAEWFVAALGIASTALGSAWYHADPCTERLFWDRLPMTLAFAGLCGAAINESLGPRAGRATLWLLLVLDPAAVLWWRHTEALGQGNLVPYALAQFLPLLILPVVMALTPRRTTGLGAWSTAFLLYMLAKALELADGVLGHWLILSGHGWKHLAAAAACAVLLHHALRRRELGALPNCEGLSLHAPLKADLFGSIRIADGPLGRWVLREIRSARWWARPLAWALMLREETALAALAGEPTGLVPRLCARDRGRLARSELAGTVLHSAAVAPPAAAFRDARHLLRSLRRRGIAHNDTHKPQNWIVLHDGRLALIDLQLASVHVMHGFAWRIQAREDLRHLLKLQERYCPGTVPPRGRRLLASKAPTTRLWLMLVKPAYNFVTRRLMGWRDGEGRG